MILFKKLLFFFNECLTDSFEFKKTKFGVIIILLALQSGCVCAALELPLAQIDCFFITIVGCTSKKIRKCIKAC